MWYRVKLGVLAAMICVAFAGLSGLATVGAQDASPAASPAAAECDSPGLPPGTPTPEEGMEGMDMASPVAATPEASPAAMEMPEATPVPEGTPADEATAAEIDAALQNYAACFNEGQAMGDPSLFVALETPNYWLLFGYDNPYNRVADETGSPFRTAAVLGMADHMVYDDGRVSVDVDLQLGDHWVRKIRYFLAQEGDTWKIDAEADLSPDLSDAESVSVVGIDLNEINDESTGERTYEFAFPGGSTTFPQTGAFVFTVTNNGVEAHEALLVQLPEGANPLGLLDGSVAFEDITFYGGVFGVLPGQTMELGMVGLEPGVYTLVCFFPSPEGVPHAALGMVAQFEIVAPAA